MKQLITLVNANYRIRVQICDAAKQDWHECKLVPCQRSFMIGAGTLCNLIGETQVRYLFERAQKNFNGNPLAFKRGNFKIILYAK